MSSNSNKAEEEVLDFIFRENANLELSDQEKLINTYHAIKHHMPTEIFEGGKLKFNYNKGLSYILASYGEIQLFKIPNDIKKSVEFICPPEKVYLDTLKMSDIAKESALNRYKDTNAKIWYVKLTADEVLYLSSYHWDGFADILKKLATN